MSLTIKNKLNLWEYKEYYRWYRIDKKIALFFQKIKWMFQRAKYGYCYKDLWNLDYTLGNYIANILTGLADITHVCPPNLTPDQWDHLLHTIAYNFYVGVDEDFWENPFDKFISYTLNYSDLDEEQKKNWDEWFKEEKKKYELMEQHLQKGIEDLSKWFYYLWD